MKRGLGWSRRPGYVYGVEQNQNAEAKGVQSLSETAETPFPEWALRSEGRPASDTGG